MSEYKKVKIGDFLEQYRNTIRINDSVEYGQITISSKDGVKFRCLKIGKEIGRKRQFVIDLKSHPNTVIFTRQGIADGSIGIAPSNVNGCIATENMPMFSVNENIILVEYLENLLISPVFKELVAIITLSGSAQKSIHERDLLQLEITLPDLETQKEIVKKVSINLKNVEILTEEIESQKAYAKQLRQHILQDAIEGKLTAEWRKKHPVIKGNPDYDAEALFEEIQKGKDFPSLQPAKQSSATPSAGSNAARNARSKEFSPITDDDKPFEIPEGWKWVRLGEVINLLSGRDFEPDGYNDKQIGIPYITGASNIGETGIIINHWTPNPKCIAKKGDLLLVCKGSGYGTLAYADFEKAHIARQVMSITSNSANIYLKYIEYILQANLNYLKSQGKGLIPGIDRETVLKIKCGLPSVLEQEEIIELVEKYKLIMSKLEQQITQREEYANQLMQSILKDAFEER